MAASHFRQDVGGGGGDDYHIWFAGEADMTDVVLVVAVEELREHLAAGEGADGQGRYEFLSRIGHYGANRSTPLAQTADEIEGFVGGNPAGNHKEDGAPGERPGQGLRRPPDGEILPRYGRGRCRLSGAEDAADLLLHGPAIGGRLEPKPGFRRLVEIADGQGRHGVC